MKKRINKSIVVGKMAYERYRLIETKDGVIRQGMGISGKVEAILVHITGGLCVRFVTDSTYNIVPIEWVTSNETLSKIDISVVESYVIRLRQPRHALCKSRLTLIKKSDSRRRKRKVSKLYY